MQMGVSSNGQNQMLLEPVEPLNLVGFTPDDLVEVTVKPAPLAANGESPEQRQARIVRDPETGWPVLTLGECAPKITSEDVAALLVDFP